MITDESGTMPVHFRKILNRTKILPAQVVEHMAGKATSKKQFNAEFRTILLPAFVALKKLMNSLNLSQLLHLWNLGEILYIISVPTWSM